MKNIQQYLPLAALIIVVLGGIFWFGMDQNRAFARDVDACNDAAKNERFSCYRKVLEDHYTNGDLKAYLDGIEANDKISFRNKDTGYAVFGTSCHTFYHAVGDFIAGHTEGEDLATRASLCSSACTSGCIMGLYKRATLQAEYSSDFINSLFPTCPKGSEHQCSHEVGHILHDKYVTSVLGVIDAISLEKYKLVQPKEYAYTNNPAADLNQPFEDCKTAVPGEELAYCDTGIGHNLFLFSEFNSGGDYAKTAAECENVDAANRDACYKFLVYRVGINDAAPKFINLDPTAGNQVCTDIVSAIGRPELIDDCYLGLGGGIGLFVDSEYAHMKLTEDKFPAIRKSVTSYIYMCEDAPELSRDECYRGLLGTPLRKLYKTLNLENDVIDSILPNIDSAFEVVG